MSRRPEAAPAAERPRQKKPRAARSRQKRITRRRRREGMDVYHLLAAVSGAFAGLVLFSLLTPGHTPLNPHKTAETQSDRLSNLRLMGLSGRRGTDGLYHVQGHIFNAHTRPCKLAHVALRFYDRRDRLVTRTVTTAEAIAANGKGVFAARAHVPGAVRFEAELELAQF